MEIIVKVIQQSANSRSTGGGGRYGRRTEKIDGDFIETDVSVISAFHIWADLKNYSSPPIAIQPFAILELYTGYEGAVESGVTF